MSVQILGFGSQYVKSKYLYSIITSFTLQVRAFDSKLTSHWKKNNKLQESSHPNDPKVIASRFFILQLIIRESNSWAPLIQLEEPFWIDSTSVAYMRIISIKHIWAQPISSIPSILSACTKDCYHLSRSYMVDEDYVVEELGCYRGSKLIFSSLVSMLREELYCNSRVE